MSIETLEDEIEELKSKLIIADGMADDHWNLLIEAREALQKIYAERGEDPFIADICNHLIDKIGK